MRPIVRKILAVLDGTPTGSRGSHGQSLVEFTLTLPLLGILLLGLAEIGWYANNYMTLLDVVREAGRFGSTKDPMTWVNGEEHKYQRMDCEELSTNYDKKPFEEHTTWSMSGPDLSAWGFIENSDDRPMGFYDGVACSVIGNMAPLEFNDMTDDIVVSVFSYVVVDQGKSTAQVHVVGRYPATANECRNSDLYDPFDWNHNGTGLDDNELEGFDDSSTNINTWEDVRGYVFRGNHRMNFGGPRDCLGSSFTTQEVENMLNFNGDPDRVNKITRVSNYGMVLVEVFWKHRQLLGLPWFNLGPINNGPMIHVWAFFPVSGAEPDLNL